MISLFLMALLGASFAVLVAAHLWIVASLSRQRPRHRALLALMIPPLAPIWAHERRWRMSLVIWLGSFVCYAIGVAATIALRSH